MMERFRRIIKILQHEPLDDTELEMTRLQQTISFNRILGEYAKGKMSKFLFMRHVKGYLYEWEKKLKRKLKEKEVVR